MKILYKKSSSASSKSLSISLDAKTFAEADEDNHPDDDKVEGNLELEISKGRLKILMVTSRLTFEALSGVDDEEKMRSLEKDLRILWRTPL